MTHFVGPGPAILTLSDAVLFGPSVTHSLGPSYIDTDSDQDAGSPAILKQTPGDAAFAGAVSMFKGLSAFSREHQS